VLAASWYNLKVGGNQKCGQKKRALVIGGGHAQLSLLEAFGEISGIAITVVDDRECIPAREISGINVVNIHRYELEEITRWIERNGIDYIAGAGSDKSVLIAAIIAKKRNLPFYCSPEVARMPLTKGKVQEVLGKAGVPIPVTMEGSEIGYFRHFLENARYPLVIKPDEGIGQASVNIASCLNEAVESLKGALHESPNGRALVQEYCHGREIGINGIVIEGVFFLLTIALRNSSRARGGAFGVAMEKVTLELPDTVKRVVVGNLEQACSAMGIVNGPVYAQAILSEDGSIVIIEIMPRLGGGEDSRLVQLATSYDLAGATAQMSLGRKVFRPAVGLLSKVVALRFLSVPPGLLRDISGVEKAGSVPGIRAVRIYYQPGQEIKPMISSRERGGYILAEGANTDSALTCLDLAERMITFDVLPTGEI
jgi:biotin carboxylase